MFGLGVGERNLENVIEDVSVSVELSEMDNLMHSTRKGPTRVYGCT